MTVRALLAVTLALAWTSATGVRAQTWTSATSPDLPAGVVAIASAPDGDVYLGGNTGLRQPLVVGGDTLVTGDRAVGYVARVSPSGAVRWARTAGAASSGRSVVGLAGDGAGGSYVLAQAGDSGGALSRVRPDGREAWSVPVASPEGAQVRALAVGADGAAYVGGLVGSTYDEAGDGQVGTADVPGGGFVAKVSVAGQVVWVRPFGFGLEPTALAVGPRGGVTMAGRLRDADLAGTRQVTAGGSDVAVVQLDGAGEPVWSRRAGGSSDDVPTAVAVDGEGRAVVAGTYQRAVRFGGVRLPAWRGASGRPFVWALGADGHTRWARADLGRVVALDAGPGGVLATTDGERGLVWLSPDGRVEWTKASAGPSGGADLRAARVGPSDRVIAAGSFEDDVYFDGTVLDRGRVRRAVLAVLDPSRSAPPVPASYRPVPTPTSPGRGGRAESRPPPFVSGGRAWARRLGSGERSSVGVDDVAAGPDGAVYATGRFSDELDLGDSTLVANGNSDVFVARFDAAGALAWVTVLGGDYGEDPGALAVGADGSVTVAGVFRRGELTPGPAVEVQGNGDLFVARLTPAGAVRWARTYGGPAFERPDALAVGPDGGVVVGGEIAETREHPGVAEFGGVTLRAAGRDDGFVLRLDDRGEPLWAVRLGGPGYDWVHSVALGADGRVVAAARVDAGADVAGRPVRVGEDNAVVVQLGPDGTVGWIAPLVGADDADVAGLALDADGGVVVAGAFRAGADLGPTPVGTGRGGFVARLAPDGRVAWTLPVTGADGAYLAALAHDPSGGVVVAGGAGGAAQAGPLALADGVFLLGVSAAGEALWTRALAADEVWPGKLSVTGDGRVALVGTAGGAVSLGPVALGPVGLRDPFVAVVPAAAGPAAPAPADGR